MCTLHCQLARGLALFVFVAIPLVSHAETPIPESGLYHVDGITTVTSTGEKRLARGKVVLVRSEGERCTMAIHLATSVERDGAVRRVDLTGECACEMVGAYLSGMCQTQWLMSAIPELDPEFELMPGKLGPRVQSSFEMKPV